MNIERISRPSHPARLLRPQAFGSGRVVAVLPLSLSHIRAVAPHAPNICHSSSAIKLGHLGVGSSRRTWTMVDACDLICEHLCNSLQLRGVDSELNSAGGSDSGQGKKHININNFGGLSQDWVSDQICLCVFWGHAFWGEKHINKIPRKSGDKAAKCLLMCFSFIECFMQEAEQRGGQFYIIFCGSPDH